MSKYKLLWKYLKENNQPSYNLTFDEIKIILGFKLDHAFLTYKKETKDYGYKVDKISLKESRVVN